MRRQDKTSFAASGPVQPGSASAPVFTASIAVQHIAPFTLFANTSAGPQSYTPGATSFTPLIPGAGNNAASLVTTPANADLFAGYATSYVLGSSSNFATSSNIAAPLVHRDSNITVYLSATRTTLFLGDYDGESFAAPYSSLLP